MKEEIECKIKKSKNCKIKLYGGVDDDIELDTACCFPCGELLYTKDQERREWDYYHSDDKE